MKEANLRKWHRRMGITLAFFIILQAGSGLLLSLAELQPAPGHAHSQAGTVSSHSPIAHPSIWRETLGFLHYRNGFVGALYRTVLGLGVVGMAVSGSTIFFKRRARVKN